MSSSDEWSDTEELELEMLKFNLKRVRADAKVCKFWVISLSILGLILLIILVSSHRSESRQGKTVLSRPSVDNTRVSPRIMLKERKQRMKVSETSKVENKTRNGV